MWTRDVARQYPKARIAVQMSATEPIYKAQRILRPDIVAGWKGKMGDDNIAEVAGESWNCGGSAGGR